MALDGSYTGLIASIGDWLNRPDLSASIADFIVIAEARINRLIRSKNVTRVDTLSLDAATVTLPLDVKEPRSLVINTARYESEIQITSPQALAREQIRLGGLTGTPRFAAVVNDVLYLAPAPDIAYTATFIYEPKVQPLATAGSNWLLLNHPDIYLYGALVASQPFLRDDPRVGQFEDWFKTSFAELELARDRSEYPNTPIEGRRRSIG